MSLQACSAKCVVRHDYDKMCEFRHIQCPFVTCTEKFPTDHYSSKFTFNDQTFAKNFAANPFLIVFNDRQFILEICRKHDTGLWHFWIYLVGSPWDSNFFSFELKITNAKGTQRLSLTAPVVSIDVSFADVFRNCHGLAVPDNMLRRFCDFNKMNVLYQIVLRPVEVADYERMPQPRIPRENGDNITINRPPQEPAFDSSNGHSFPGNGSYYEPQEPARPQYTFANAPKVGTGIPNKYGKVIYPDSHKLFIGNLFTECKDDLIEIFSPFGEIADVLFFKNSQLMRKFPFYAFVVFKDEGAVGLACQNKPFHFPNGQAIIVQPKFDPPGLIHVGYPRQPSTEPEIDGKGTKGKKRY